MPDVTPTSTDQGFLQDINCLECGYNLRGLLGDPVRCPECFHEYPLTELHARLRDLDLRKVDPLEQARRSIETRAMLFGVGVVPGLVTGVMYLGGDSITAGIVRLAMLVSALICILGLVLLVSRCWRVPGWFTLLLAYLPWACLASTGNMLVAVGGTLAFMTSCIALADGGGILISLMSPFFLIPLAVRLDPLRICRRPGRRALDQLAQGVAQAQLRRQSGM
jgi:hypothetical protein